MTNKEVILKTKRNPSRGSTYKYFKGSRPPGKIQEKLLKKHRILFDVDPEIRKIVIALNEKGIKTLGSCAGHHPNELDGFVTIANTVENTDMNALKNIFKQNGIDNININTTLWTNWFSVEFESVGKDLSLLEDTTLLVDTSKYTLEQFCQIHFPGGILKQKHYFTYNGIKYEIWPIKTIGVEMENVKAYSLKCKHNNIDKR